MDNEPYLALQGLWPGVRARKVFGSDADKPNVAIIHSPDHDWLGIYVNGQLQYQGHSATPSMVLDALGVAHVDRSDWNPDNDAGQLPQILAHATFLKGDGSD